MQYSKMPYFIKLTGLSSSERKEEKENRGERSCNRWLAIKVYWIDRTKQATEGRMHRRGLMRMKTWSVLVSIACVCNSSGKAGAHWWKFGILPGWAWHCGARRWPVPATPVEVHETCLDGSYGVPTPRRSPPPTSSRPWSPTSYTSMEVISFLNMLPFLY
jgi:hypothetical protein